MKTLLQKELKLSKFEQSISAWISKMWFRHCYKKALLVGHRQFDNFGIFSTLSKIVIFFIIIYQTRNFYAQRYEDECEFFFNNFKM